MFFFFFKQKTAYEMRISDWSSDVCSSDLLAALGHGFGEGGFRTAQRFGRRNAGIVARLYDDPANDGMNRHGRIEIREHRRRSRCSTALAPGVLRSEKRRVGKKSVRTCRSRRSQSHNNKKQKQSINR